MLLLRQVTWRSAVPGRWLRTYLAGAFCCAIVSCRWRPSNSSSQVTASSNANPFAWLQVDSHAESPGVSVVRVCIIDSKPAEKVGAGTTKISLISDAMDAAFRTWIKYVDDHEVELSEQNYPEPVRFRFPRFPFLLFDCAKPADITVIAGSVPQEFQNRIAHDDGLYASATLLDPLATTLRHQGVIWLAGHSDHPESSDDPTKITINYGSGKALEWIFLHEVGHVFGNPHVPGTIMDSQLLDAALKDETIFAPLRAAALFPEPPNQVSIDLVRDLMICRRCYQKQEILGGTDAGQNKSKLTIRPYQGANTKDANYHVTNSTLHMSFLAATAEIKQGPEIFRRISLPDSERVYHQARRDVVTPEADKNVKIILERNWKDLHQPGVNLSVSCENNEVSVFANDVPEFARRFWEVYRTDPRLNDPSDGDNLNFGTMFSCIDKITGSGNRAKTIACKKQAQEFIDAKPIPKLEFTTFRVAPPFELAMRKSFQDHAFGGCSVLKPDSDRSRLCLFKLGTVPYLYIWNELFSTTIRLEEHYRQRQKTANGYTLTFGGTGNFSVYKKIADYQVELKMDSKKQSDGTERRRLIQLSVLTTVSGLDPTCSPDLMMNQPLTSGPLELTFVDNELSGIF